MKPTTVRVTRETVKEEEYRGWDYACGAAVREALDGAVSVTLTDTDGSQYYIFAESVEDNS